MKLDCFYHCRFCQANFPDVIETDEPLENILTYLFRYNFMYKAHECEKGPSNIAKKMKGVIGVADLTGLRLAEEEDAESIHSDNKG
jgi:hypothetical protein